MSEYESSYLETPESTKDLHPILEQVFSELEEEEKEYFKEKSNFKTLFSKELEILSTNLQLLLGEYGKSRMKYFKGNQGEQTGDSEVLKDYLKLGIKQAIEVDKKYKENHGSYSQFPEAMRSTTVQVVRQGYFAFLERAVAQGNMDERIKQAFDEGFFPDNWDCTVVVSKDFDMGKTARLLEQTDFPSDTARVTYVSLDNGQIYSSPINENDLKVLEKANLAPRIKKLSISAYPTEEGKASFSNAHKGTEVRFY